ncbi:MAG: carbonic anhydrase [Acidimicrobiia bacterium]|nr:carbonic anhydrase [Acidimicrobiia bacterium]
MSNLSPFLQRNRTFAESDAHDGLTPIPTHQLIIVTCMDGRVDPAHILGVDLGDALVIRNAGGRVTADVVQEIAFVGMVTEMMFGDNAPGFEVAVIHHTSCGSAFLADPEFRAGLAARTGSDESDLADAAVTDPTASIAHDLDVLARSEVVPKRASISGHVYDVSTGLVTTCG